MDRQKDCKKCFDWKLDLVAETLTRDKSIRVNSKKRHLSLSTYGDYVQGEIFRIGLKKHKRVMPPQDVLDLHLKDVLSMKLVHILTFTTYIGSVFPEDI